MKHIGIATFAAGLLLATAAFAEPQHKGGAPHAAPHGGGAAHVSAPRGGNFSHGGGAAHFSAPRGGNFSRARTPAYQNSAPSRGYATYEHRNYMTNGASRPYRGGNSALERSNVSYTHGSNVTAGAPRRGAMPNYGRDARGYGMRPGNWNDRPRDFDRGQYQFNATATERFHWGHYDRPDGWYYRRWGYGEYLPAAFWARDYWLTSWWMFDLPIPPYGFEWVRYGADALLINIYSGQILEVEYGVFY